jgi:hypothetical protein
MKYAPGYSLDAEDVVSGLVGAVAHEENSVGVLLVQDVVGLLTRQLTSKVAGEEKSRRLYEGHNHRRRAWGVQRGTRRPQVAPPVGGPPLKWP